MNIGHLKLPEELTSAIQSKSLHRKVGSWPLKSEIDSYGNQLETELGQLFESNEEITEATKRLCEDFLPDGEYAEDSEVSYPSAIPDILDFQDVVCFGVAGDGSPFCLDYRESKEEPSVIWWDDIYWRKVSPSVGEFLALLEISC